MGLRAKLPYFVGVSSSEGELIFPNPLYNSTAGFKVVLASNPSHVKGFMTTYSSLKLSALILLTGLSLNAQAGNISGTYSNDCTAMVKLWDVSGNYSADYDVESDTVTLNMDATGAITGTGHVDINDYYESVYLSGDFTVAGKVSSAGRVTRVSLTLVVKSGTGVVDGYDVIFQATLKENFEINADYREFTGKSSGKLKLTVPAFGKSKSFPMPSAYTSMALPDEVDGAWGLSGNIVPAGTKYGGTSVITLSNGKTVNLGVTGSYASRTDTSKLSLKSTDQIKAAALNLVARQAADKVSILSLKGKALGQNVQATY